MEQPGCLQEGEAARVSEEDLVHKLKHGEEDTLIKKEGGAGVLQATATKCLSALRVPLSICTSVAGLRTPTALRTMARVSKEKPQLLLIAH